MIDLAELIRRSHDLDPLPATATRLTGLVGRPDPSVAEIVEIVSFDQALTARVLRVANSATSASRFPIATVKDAVLLLGTGAVLSLAVGAGVETQLRRRLPEYGFEEDQLWRHSVAAATVAESLPRFTRVEIPPEVFTAALLHDIGKLVMGRFLTAEVREVLQRAVADGGMGPVKAESEVLQAHHGEVGGLVAQHWRLPEGLVRAIIFHHAPTEGASVGCDVAYLSNLVAHQIDAVGAPGPDRAELPAVSSRLELADRALTDLVTCAAERFEEVMRRFQADTW